jgi:hypothetical protein
MNWVWKLKGFFGPGLLGSPFASPSSVAMAKADSGVGGRSDVEWWGWRKAAGLLREEAARKCLRSGELANGGSRVCWSRFRPLS